MNIYFPGCMATYRMTKVAKSAIEIMKRAGLDFTTLGSEEWCCGSVLLRTGNTDAAKEVMEHNIKAFQDIDAKRVITTCSGCYKTLKIDYSKAAGDLDFAVVHLPELVKEFLDEGCIRFRENSIKVTYHDPCHLGRHSGMYDIPRDVIRAVPGIELIEMGRSREFARCCGAGGGMLSANKELAREIGDDRIKDAIETGASVLTTPCPFCTFHLADAAKKVGSEIRVLDFAEFVLENME